MRVYRADVDSRLKLLDKRYGGISYSNGKMAEDYFFNVFQRDRTFVNEKFDKIQPNFRCEVDDSDDSPCAPAAELDIFLFNGKSAAIIEVKYRADKENIDINHLVSRIAIVKRLYPEYVNHRFYLGVVAMSFDKKIAKQLRKTGIATIHHTGKKMVVYDKEVKVF